MSNPAARLGDQTSHGGLITSGHPLVVIGGMPAARLGDMHACPAVTGTVPHVGGPVIGSAFTVLVGGMPLARVGDMAICIGPPDSIAVGEPSVVAGALGGAGLMGILRGLAIAGAAVLERILGGGYPRAVLKTDAAGNPIRDAQGRPQFVTQYSKGILLDGPPERVGRNIHQLDTIREGPGGRAFLDAADQAATPITVDVVGDPAGARDLFPGKQSYGNCAVQSSQQIIHQATGNNFSETQMETIANSPNQSGYNRAGGTPIPGIETVLENGGVPSHMEPGTIANIDNALSHGQGVVSTHDPGLLWDDANYLGQGHAVVTTGAIRDSSGKTLAYIINDTGTGEAERTVPAADYAASLLGTDVGVTDNPIW